MKKTTFKSDRPKALRQEYLRSILPLLASIEFGQDELSMWTLEDPTQWKGGIVNRPILKPIGTSISLSEYDETEPTL